MSFFRHMSYVSLSRYLCNGVCRFLKQTRLDHAMDIVSHCMCILVCALVGSNMLNCGYVTC